MGWHCSDDCMVMNHCIGKVTCSLCGHEDCPDEMEQDGFDPTISEWYCPKCWEEVEREREEEEEEDDEDDED